MKILRKHFAQIDSTNNAIRLWMNEFVVLVDYSHLLLTADFQSSGRGQVGNSWESAAASNILMSMGLRPQCLNVHQQFFLSMAVSNAIVQALEMHIDGVKVKWPNDIYVGRQKLAGILIENKLRGAQIAETIVGLGLNVNQTEFLSDAPNPVSLRNLTGTTFDREALTTSIAHNIVQWKSQVDAEQWQAIAEVYLAHLLRFDNQLHPFSDASGPFMARIVGVEADGHLVLLTSSGERRAYAFKEVEHVFQHD